ncbi:MAG: hypothetical protein NTV01_13930 [Bacteroidia bacterium]|nr:hypothetical protein [Bacteroidia bacterium]
MKNFNYHQSTKIIFGCGRIDELTEVVSRYGKKALLVTTSAENQSLEEQYARVKSLLSSKGVLVAHFDVLCHAFESTINPGTGVYVDLLAWEAAISQFAKLAETDNYLSLQN